MKDKSKNNKDDFLEKEFNFSKALVGPILTGSGIKLPVSIRLDAEIIDYFKEKAGEKDCKSKYQTLINDALREHIAGVNIKKVLLSEDFISSLSKSLKQA